MLLSSPSCATCVVCLLGDEDVSGTGDGQLCCIGCGRQYHIQWCQGTSAEKGLKMCGTIFLLRGCVRVDMNIMRFPPPSGILVLGGHKVAPPLIRDLGLGGLIHVCEK